jgi:glycine dehydrogenase
MSMCGGQGLKECSISALLASNYMKQRLAPHFKIPYTNENNMVSHEFIIDTKEFKPITERDICKRLMDYGFHGPTMSWPVNSSLMIEPTECEDLEELDRFIDALINIKNEIVHIKAHGLESSSNLLINSPHSKNLLYEDEWKYDYSKEEAYFPLEYIKNRKFDIPVSRIDDTFGDLNLVIKDET